MRTKDSIETLTLQWDAKQRMIQWHFQIVVCQHEINPKVARGKVP